MDPAAMKVIEYIFKIIEWGFIYWYITFPIIIIGGIFQDRNKGRGG